MRVFRLRLISLFTLAVASSFAMANRGGFHPRILQLKNESGLTTIKTASLVSIPTASHPWKATYDLDTGYVRMLYSGESKPDPKSSEAAARSFLTANAGIFGIEDVNRLRFSERIKTNLGETIRFQQIYKGLRVIPGDVSVSRNRSGSVFLVSSSYRPNLSLDVTPFISAEKARKLALNATLVGKPSNPELIVWSESRPYRLAWRVDVYVKDSRIDRVLTDAKSGRVFARYNRVSNVDPTANVYLGNPVSTSKTTQVLLQNLDASGSLTGKYVTVYKFNGYDANGNAKGAIDLKNTGSGFDVPASDSRFAQTMMYFQVNRWHDYFKNTFNFNQRDASMPSYVEVTNEDKSALNNAFFSPACDCIEFGLSDQGQDYSLDSDVIGHEYTHSIVDKLNKIGDNDRWTEARAMNEALADYFSSTVIGEGCMGEYVTGKTDGSCGRDLTNRKRYPDEVDESIDVSSVGTIYVFPEEHHTGEIWGAALWDLRRYLGNKVADKIIYDSLALYPDHATFSDARIAMKTADQQAGNSNGDAIAQVMDNRGIPEQALATYAQPDQFTPDDQHVVMTGLLGTEGGSYTPVGFLPVFVSGRHYVLIGFDYGDSNLKDIGLVFMDSQKNIKQIFSGNLAQVKLKTNSGDLDVTRFQINVQMPVGQEGSYLVAIGTSADGKSYGIANALAGVVVKEGGDAPLPSHEVASTPPSVPLPNVTTSTPPSTAPSVTQTPASIHISPTITSLSVGKSQQFSAEVIDTAGEAISDATVNWTLSDSSDLADITPNGYLSAKKAGNVSVLASIGSVQGKLSLVIEAAASPAGVSAWKQLPGGETAGVFSLSGATSNGQTMIYEAGIDSVRASANGGAFKDIIAGLDSSTTPTSIAASSGNPNLVYLATLEFGVYRSVNGGQTWQPFTDELAQALGDIECSDFFNCWLYYPEFVSVTTDQIGNIALGTADAGTYVWLNSQGWLDVSAGLNSASIFSMAFDKDGTVFYSGSNAGMYRLRANDKAWVPINNGLVGPGFEGQNYSLPPSIYQVAINPNDKLQVLAATFGAGVFYTSDGGDNWVSANSGITDKNILTVVFDPATPGRMFAGTESDGAFVSTDYGKSWQPARAGLTTGAVTSLLFDPSNSKRLLAGTWGAGVWALDLSGDIVSDTGGSTSSNGGSTGGTTTVLAGDVNGDGKVNVQDATVALRIAVGVLTPTDSQKAGADMNDDGKINVQDVTLLLKKAVGI